YHAKWTDPERVFTESDFRPDDNVGARWGVLSNGYIDIDCDDLRACRIAEQIIRQGPRWGRDHKPNSHYLAHSPNVKARQFINPITNKMIVEVRSTGSQSVLPGSIHPSGEAYRWERKEPAVSVDAQPLYAGVGEIASATLVASLWTENIRHFFALEL